MYSKGNWFAIVMRFECDLRPIKQKKCGDPWKVLCVGIFVLGFRDASGSKTSYRDAGRNLITEGSKSLLR